MANRLSKESSLYLRQHGGNPVDWWPWCLEAFEVARRENKLILVSIGYASCHWCHVMAHECFEDGYIADLMNKYFVCIKVDREERPDVDQLFVEVVQMITGRAGWPLNVFCLPDGHPFFAGTYFPPKDIGQGIIPWPQLLMRLVEHFKRAPEELVENAGNIVQNLKISNNPGQRQGMELSLERLLEGAKGICATHDDEWGGFGGAPKFPSPTVLEYLFVIDDEVLMARLDEVLMKSLMGMAHGGIFDQIGGGFSRYTVDRFWLIPHFEKMLYDNALLITAYTKGWLRFGLMLFKSVVEETVGWLEREMMHGNGMFSAALDADSEAGEGIYYVWRPEEILEVLGTKDGKLFCEAYGVTKKGNFEEGRSVLTWLYNDDQKRVDFKPLRDKLLRAREQRPKPAKDDKILVSWNALLAKGLVYAGFYFNKPEWLVMGKRIVDWIWDHMLDGDYRMMGVYYEDAVDKRGGAFLDDYAFYIEACLALAGKVDWIEIGASKVYIERAQKLMGVVFEYFKDKSAAGFFFTALDAEKLVARKKYWLDQAIPTGNASLVHCLSQLYALLGDGIYREAFVQLKDSYVGLVQHASAVAYGLAGFVEDELGVVVLKINVDKQTAEEVQKTMDRIRDYLAKKPYRNVFILTQIFCDKKYQLCMGSQCFEPEDDLESVLKKIFI